MPALLLQPPKVRDCIVDVPGDKSISHRAIMLASIARGRTTIRNANRGADVAATIEAMRRVGVAIEEHSDGALQVVGAASFRNPDAPIDCANSGTTMRLLAGLFAGRVDATLDGDSSLRKRPMRRVALPLQAMGADVATGPDGRPPVTLRRAGPRLQGRRFALETASAQVKSAILFAGLNAEGETIVVDPLPTRDHTERMLRAMGAHIEVRADGISLRGSVLQALDLLSVPGDFSSAFFIIAAAAAIPGTRVVVRNVGVNPTRTAALDVARAMGVDVRLRNEQVLSGEPVADIETIGRESLRGCVVPPEVVPNLIDEIPALCALAAGASGEFVVRGAAELRTKESDRIATVASLLRSFHAPVEELADGLVVHGSGDLRAPQRVGTAGDHRVGMAAAILAARTASGLRIDDAECIATSFSGFEEVWRAAFG